MTITDWVNSLLDAAGRHAPPGAEWLPLASAAAAVGLLGILLLVKGARLAPILAALVFAGVGALGGLWLGRWLGMPLLPSVAGAAAAGLLLGVLLFKFWLATLLALCLMAGSLAFYGDRVLRGPLEAYLSQGFDQQRQLVTLPQAETPKLEPWQTRLANLWSYLAGNVTDFQSSLLAISISTGLAGLVLGLLLPNLARAIWAASFGTGLLMLSVYSLVHLRWPAMGGWLSQWWLHAAGGLWSLSTLYNFFDVRSLRPRKSPASAQKTSN